MNSSVVALISCMSSSERPRKGRAGMLTLTFFLLIHCPPTWKRRFFARFARMVRPLSPNWWVAACFTFVPTANPEASARRLDGVAELGGVDKGLSPGLCRPDGGLPPLAVRPPALLEPFEGRLPDAFGEGGVEALPVKLRITPHFSEEGGGVSLQSDAIHALHPPHAAPGEKPDV